VFSIVDAFAGKKKLKDALSGVLSDVKQKSPENRGFSVLHLFNFTIYLA
jgi:hypothetical protein